jgi:DNA-binding NtrC family response regulator
MSRGIINKHIGYWHGILILTGGNKAETAKRLGISRRALYDKIEKYGIAK